jgi:hypothetical protein
MHYRLRVVALIPDYNNKSGTAEALDAEFAQGRVPDQILVIPNGRTDRTTAVARRHPMTVLKPPRGVAEKTEAPGIGWTRSTQDTDAVIEPDADTVRQTHAVEYRGHGFLGRRQHAEFAA